LHADKPSPLLSESECLPKVVADLFRRARQHNRKGLSDCNQRPFRSPDLGNYMRFQLLSSQGHAQTRKIGLPQRVSQGWKSECLASRATWSNLTLGSESHPARLQTSGLTLLDVEAWSPQLHSQHLTSSLSVHVGWWIK
jgi:hypothetical protein